MKTVLLFLTAIIFLFGCDTIVNEQKTNTLRQFTDEPISITWNGEKEAGVQSYQATVRVFSKNSRRDTYPSLSYTYRLALSNIGSRIVTRIDFEEGEDYSSILSDGEEAVVFNPLTEEIVHRITLDNANSPLHRIFGNQSGMSRVNLSLVREEARRLSLNMSEETVGVNNRLLLELPAAMIPANGLDTITSSRVKFDIATETLIETEVIMVREDGTVVVTTATPVYEVSDGVPVKIGMITTIDSRAPVPVGGYDPDVEFFNSIEDIPEITEEQLAQMRAEGNVHEMPSVTFGHPSDLSYVETVYEVYQGIEINSAPDSLFRLIAR